MGAMHTSVPWFREKALPTQVLRHHLPVIMVNDVAIARLIGVDIRRWRRRDGAVFMMASARLFEAGCQVRNEADVALTH
jgi:hypothetical protein